MGGLCTKCPTLNTWSFLISRALLTVSLVCESFGRALPLCSSSSVSISSSSAAT